MQRWEMRLKTRQASDPEEPYRPGQGAGDTSRQAKGSKVTWPNLLLFPPYLPSMGGSREGSEGAL